MQIQSSGGGADSEGRERLLQHREDEEEKTRKGEIGGREERDGLRVTKTKEGKSNAVVIRKSMLLLFFSLSAGQTWPIGGRDSVTENDVLEGQQKHVRPPP